MQFHVKDRSLSSNRNRNLPELKINIRSGYPRTGILLNLEIFIYFELKIFWLVLAVK